MRRQFIAALCCVPLLALTAAAGTPAAADQDPGHTIAPKLRAQLADVGPNQMVNVIVTLREQADLTAVGGATRAIRLRRVVARLHTAADDAQDPLARRLAVLQDSGQVRRFEPFWIFDGLAVTATADAVREIANRADVQAVTPDRTIHAPTTIEAPVTATAESVEPNIGLTNAPALWQRGINGTGVVVASMDTGVDLTQPDLAERWRGGTNSWFDPNGEHATPTDVNGHGTWTMGVMVGDTGSGSAIGMAPGARWVAVKIFNDADIATSSNIHAGYQWLLDPDGDPTSADAPAVVNNSWSLGSIGCNLEFQLDLQGLRAAGIVPVFAAGNFGPDPATSASPANNPEALAVGATDNADTMFTASSRGPSSCGEPETTFPELVAPGVDVHTTDLYGLMTQQSGTSLAAPHAAGALALLLDAYPALPPSAQETALTQGAVDLGPVGSDDDSGSGRLDVLAAYDWLSAQHDFALAISPSSRIITRGNTTSFEINVTPLGGSPESTRLSVTGLPPRATARLRPTSIIPPGSSKLTIKTTRRTPPGSFTLTVTAQSGSITHQATATLTVS